MYRHKLEHLVLLQIGDLRLRYFGAVLYRVEAQFVGADRWFRVAGTGIANPADKIHVPDAAQRGSSAENEHTAG